jgi:cell wall-associated NlpC family hydrolase
LPFIGLLAACLFAVAPASGSSPIDQKKAEAQQVYDEIIQLDQNLSVADEKINLANIRLAQVAAEQRFNRRELGIARQNLIRSRKMIEQRVLALYNSSTPSTLDLILGASTVGDLMTRLDNANRLSSLDQQVIGQVQTFKSAVTEHARELRNEHNDAVHLLAQRRAVRASVASELNQRQQLLGSIKNQIATLEAQQRQRELEAVKAAEARAAAAQAAQEAREQATVVGASAATPVTQQAPTGGGTPAPTPAATPTPTPSTPSPPPAPTVVNPSSPYGSQVVSIAMSYIGTPYVWGGAAPGGFDCSGLVMYSFAQLGISLPHSSYAMFNYGVPVAYSQLEPGDLVFFDSLGHVGIYIGGGEYVDAPYTGAYVRVDSLSNSWAAANYSGARRIT